MSSLRCVMIAFMMIYDEVSIAMFLKCALIDKPPYSRSCWNGLFYTDKWPSTDAECIYTILHPSFGCCILTLILPASTTASRVGEWLLRLELLTGISQPCSQISCLPLSIS